MTPTFTRVGVELDAAADLVARVGVSIAGLRSRLGRVQPGLLGKAPAYGSMALQRCNG